MSINIELYPCPIQLDAQLLQRIQPRLIRQLARPDPLHAQRRLAPTVRVSARVILHSHAHPCADHARQDLAAELQRDARLDGEEKEFAGDWTNHAGLGG